MIGRVMNGYRITAAATLWRTGMQDSIVFLAIRERGPKGAEYVVAEIAYKDMETATEWWWGDYTSDATKAMQTFLRRSQALEAADMIPQPSPFKAITTEGGVTWEPWTNGWSVGFKVTAPVERDGRETAYVYVNPSGDSDDGVATAFFYSGMHGHPGSDPVVGEHVEPLTHLETPLEWWTFDTHASEWQTRWTEERQP